MNEPDSPLFRYLDTLHRVVAVLTVRQSFRAALQEILDALAEHLDFERPHIVVQDPESMNLRLSLAYGQANAPHVALCPGQGDHRTGFCRRAIDHRPLHEGSPRFPQPPF